MPLFRNIHHNPEIFLDPQNFDPSRFEVCGVANKGLKISQIYRSKLQFYHVFIFLIICGCGWMQVAPKPNTFMPFGNGEHACPGNELAKLETLILIHHLLTKFKYDTKDN
jgi:(+)-abscisic acid 8'-hydroxylase